MIYVIKLVNGDVTIAIWHKRWFEKDVHENFYLKLTKLHIKAIKGNINFKL